LSSGFLKGELTRFFAPHPEIAAFMENQYGRTDQQYIWFGRNDFAPVQALLEQIVEEDERKLPGHHLVIKGYLVRLFGLLAENHNYVCHYQSRSEIEENLVAEILKYMEDHLADVDRTGLAAFFHFNPDYLNRFLVRMTGENYSSNLRRIRLQRAAEELKHTDKSVNDIIHGLGFSNKGHFNRMFSEMYGMLPGAYRKEQ
jgi:AraC family L-rhamnose operon regulatory protein RhaS